MSDSAGPLGSAAAGDHPGGPRHPGSRGGGHIAGAIAPARRRLPLLLLGHALMRVAGSASGILVGLYLARLANRGARVSVALVGTLGAVSFGAELLSAVPMGLLSDALAPRALMTGGALLGALATQLFGMSGQLSIFFLSRTLEGLGAAAGVPSLLAHLTDVTDGDRALRARVMSYFELSLLAGLALGGLVGSQLWRRHDAGAFTAVASGYGLAAGLLLWGAVGSRSHGTARALSGFRRALRDPSLRRLAPVWLCVNSIVGLWLGPTLAFLLTQRAPSDQFLVGVFADQPEHVGWVLLGYSLVFGTGVTAWSLVLPRVPAPRVLRIALVAMVGACLGLALLNHSAPWGAPVRWAIGASTAVCVMVESGFTPAALALLATAVGAQPGRGAAMGIYSVLLSLGAIVGSLLAAVLGDRFAVDGLIAGTFGLAVVALVSVKRVEAPTPHGGENAHAVTRL